MSLFPMAFVADLEQQGKSANSCWNSFKQVFLRKWRFQCTSTEFNAILGTKQHLREMLHDCLRVNREIHVPRLNTRYRSNRTELLTLNSKILDHCNRGWVSRAQHVYVYHKHAIDSRSNQSVDRQAKSTRVASTSMPSSLSFRSAKTNRNES